MDPVLAWAQAKQKELTAFLKELVECESPSDDPAAVARFVDLFASRISGDAKVRTIRPNGGKYGPHMLCDFRLPGRGKEGQVLLLGHSDTVYPMGSLAFMPFREQNGSITGPGIFDMKGGLAILVFAMRALRELGLPVGRKVVLQVNSDEEIGSPTSRALTEEQAGRSVAVLVAEPAFGENGMAKTARKGVGDVELRVRGKASHSGLDFSSGASAILEMAHQIRAISVFTDLRSGVTVNPGVIRGGTRANIVADEAWCDVDVRVWKTRDWNRIERKFRLLKPVDKRCSIEVTAALNRPPLERSKEGTALYREARRIAADLGFELGQTAVGGGSDGNFTAALGVPTLDGLGAVGSGAHSPQEQILAEHLPLRVAMIARLVQAL